MVPGLDTERISKHLEDISESLRILASFRPASFDLFASDPKTQWAVEKGLERCIQDVLDVCAHILAALGAPVPDDYASIIHELGRKHVLPPEFAMRIAPMAGFRNILVHRYLDVDLREVYSVLTNRLDDFRQFARYVVEFIDANR